MDLYYDSVKLDCKRTLSDQFIQLDMENSFKEHTINYLCVHYPLQLAGHILSGSREEMNERFFNLLTSSDSNNDAIVAAFIVLKFLLCWFHVNKDIAIKGVNDIQRVIIIAVKQIMCTQLSKNRSRVDAPRQYFLISAYSEYLIR